MNIENFPAWKNGEYCTVKDLSISILDLGLIHCDATYDVISCHNSKIFLLDEHLDRFFASAKHWRLDVPLKRRDLKDIIKTLCKLSNQENLLIWIGLTRGIPRSGNPRDLNNCETNLFLYVKPYFGFNKTNSASVCMSEVVRVPDFSINQTYKNFAWNDLSLAQWEAIDKKFDTAVLCDLNGFVTEGPGFNIFIVKNSAVYTPSRNCLGGITVLAVERLCKENNIEFQRTELTVDDLNNADNIFLASTAGNLIDVDQFENIVFTNQLDLVKDLKKAFQEKLNDPKWSTCL